MSNHPYQQSPDCSRYDWRGPTIWMLLVLSVLAVVPGESLARPPEAICSAVSPDDTSHKLPEGYRTKRLEKLFKEVKTRSRHKVRFTKLRGEAIREKLMGRTTFCSDEIVVQLAPLTSKEQRENVIAHELFHIILQSEGFIRATAVPKGDLFLSAVASTLSSCVEDALIDRRMKAAGFRPEVISDVQAKEMMGPYRFPDSTVQDEGFQKHAALRLYCFCFRMSRVSIAEIEARTSQLHPAIVRHARELRDRLGIRRCDDPTSCFDNTKRLRDLMGYPIWLENPLTGKFE